jgi:hypothetical protein
VGELKVGFGGGFLKYLFGGTAEAKVGVKKAAGKKDTKSQSRQTQWLPIRTPQRQLEQLIFNYLEFVPDRVLQLAGNQTQPLFDREFAQRSPRAIVVLDLAGEKEAGNTHPKAKFIPMAAETENGVKLLYPLLKEIQDKKRATAQALTPPPPQEDAAQQAPRTSTDLAADYWLPYVDQFDSWDAMKVLEDGVAGYRIRWIDFRIPVNTTGAGQDERTIHLHLTPGEQYDTGVFAYNMIQRGFMQGLRIVATLKSGADLNVLAVYEK